MKTLITISIALLTLIHTVSAQPPGFSSVEPLSKNATLVYGSGLAVRLQ